MRKRGTIDSKHWAHASIAEMAGKVGNTAMMALRVL